MRRSSMHKERHLIGRVGWLRAAVLGANDGIVSTASLIVGVATAGAAKGDIVVAGAAALVAGAMSMAAGEFVSVSSQSDTEDADIAREAGELAASPEFEQKELAEIYVARGLDPELARQVASQLMTKNALSAHMRDELGVSETTSARPLQAALASAATFAFGGLLPLLIVFVTPANALVSTISLSTLVFLGVLGAIAARTGGAAILKPVVRVVFWGALALGITAGVGAIFETVS